MTLFLIFIDRPGQVCKFWMGFVKTLETGRVEVY